MGGKGGGRGGGVVRSVVRCDGQRGPRDPVGYCDRLGCMGWLLSPWERPSPCAARVEASTALQRQQRHWPVLRRPVAMAVHRVMHWLHWLR